MLDTRESRRKVPGIDIDIRAHDREAVEAHPIPSRIKTPQDSSTDSSVVKQVRSIAARHSRVLVCLDSNHTHEHVMAELLAYAQLTSAGSYCVVFDTVVEDMPLKFCVGRPWGKGDSPHSATTEYLRSHPEVVINKSIHQRLQITVAVDGYLKCVA
jgi:cephalosporin hydroxylase